MTAAELGELLSLKENYIRTHWTRIVKVYERRAIYLYKNGRGEDANYGVKLPWESEVHWSLDTLDMM